MHEGIRSLDELLPGAAVPGTRVPGAFDPFEIAVRAVLGQQISVQAANKLAARIAAAYGTPVDFGAGGCDEVDDSGPCAASGERGESGGAGGAPFGLRFLFPTARDFLSLDPIEDALGELGVIKTRSRTIRELARLAVEGELDLGRVPMPRSKLKRCLRSKASDRGRPTTSPCAHSATLMRFWRRMPVSSTRCPTFRPKSVWPPPSDGVLGGHMRMYAYGTRWDEAACSRQPLCSIDRKESL